MCFFPMELVAYSTSCLMLIFVSSYARIVAGVLRGPAGSSCPEHKAAVKCLIDPCDVKGSCRTYPTARCIADYCGGCNVRYFVGKREVTKDCQDALLCDDLEQSVVKCLVNPCQAAARCPELPQAAVCKAICGCFAEYFLGSRNVTHLCSRPPIANNAIITTMSMRCPPERSLVSCLERPCDVTTCPKFPSAYCRDDYCGGCFARYFLENSEVTESCHEPVWTTPSVDPVKCSPGVPVVKCFGRPCATATCPNYPDAVCRDDYCGHCQAKFFLRVWDITDNCNGDWKSAQW